MAEKKLTKEQRARLRANLKKLPEQAWTVVLGEDVLCIVKRGVRGYYRTDVKLSARDPHAQADDLNHRLKVSKAEAEALLVGSMVGFHTIGADPDNYKGVFK